MTLAQLADILHDRGCSCAIAQNDRLTLCNRRGVIDLYSLLQAAPAELQGAMVADKVIGKGAAALMALGGVKEVYADVISRPALALLGDYDIPVTCIRTVPNIINRAGTGICPVEQLCSQCNTAAECLPLIENFINRISNDKKQ